MALLVGQINLNKCRAAVVELNRRSELDVVLVTEPYVYKNRVAGMEPRNDVVAAKAVAPRACIRSSLKTWPVEAFLDRDMSTAAVQTEGGVVYLCSAYMDIEFEVHDSKLWRLVDWCGENNHKLIIGMDSNAHSPVWGARDLNRRGEQLEELIHSKDLLVLNRGETPTFVRGGGTVIDITLVNRAAWSTLHIGDWEVDPEESFSDHRYVVFKLGLGPGAEDSMTRNLRKADWDLFALAQSCLTLPAVEADGSNLELCAEAFTDRVKEALDISCPKRPLLPRRPNSWWSKELDELRAAVRAAGQKRRSHPTQREAYVALRRMYSKAILKAKKQSWREFCSKAEGAKDISRLIKTLEGGPTRKVSLLTAPDGATLEPGRSLDELLRTHFPDSTPVDMDDQGRSACETPESAPTSHAVNDSVISYVDVPKVLEAMKSFGDFKAPGPDQLAPVILKHLNLDFVKYLTTMFRASLSSGTIPRGWREMRVVFIPKVGKTDYTVPKAYRPISLSSFVLKTLERVLLWYILDHSIREPLVNQHAYTRGLSTETALSTFVDKVESAILRGRMCLAVSLDCSGAFDSILFSSAYDAMRDKGVPHAISTWYDRLLRHRCVIADLQGVQRAVRPGRGSPQGGILSPLVWNMVMDSLLSQFKGRAVQCVGYADDVLLFVQGLDISVMESLMNQTLDLVYRWGKERGLNFNPGKTTAICFSRSRKKVRDPLLRMGGENLTCQNSLKYLGVKFTRTLSWADHVTDAVKKCRSVMARSRAIIGREWGLTPQRSLWMYKAIVRPKLSYASLVWAGSLTGTMRDKMKRLQRLVLLSIFHPLRSTPTAGLEVIIGLIPLDLFVEREAVSARIRTRGLVRDTWDGLGNSGKAKGHRRRWDDRVRGVVSPSTVTDRITTTRNWVHDDGMFEPSVVVYTDGSKQGASEQAGYGWIVTKGDAVLAEGFGRLERATVFQAEVYAVGQALEALGTEELAPKVTGDCIIFTDSTSARQAIRSPFVSSKLVARVQEKLKTARSCRKVNIEWIKGHANHTGNEVADSLAKLGREAARVEAVPLSGSFIKDRIRGAFLSEWQDRWSSDTTCLTTYRFLPSVDEKRQSLVKDSKCRINLLGQVCTGHGLFRGHLAKWRTIDPTCSLCGEGEESSWHLWVDCPALEVRRRMLPHDNETTFGNITGLFSSPTVASLMERNGDLCH